MLTLSDGKQGISRREFLTIGSLGLGGLSLTSLMAGRAAAAPKTPDHLTDKSVIFLFQQGGPSQLETFDPKPDAPDGIRTVTGTVQTSIPGVRFGDTMAQLAPLAHRLTIVRSFQTNNGGHNIQPLVSPDTLNANIGSLYSRVAGATRPATGMPTNAVVFPQSVCPDVTKGQGRGDLSATGALGQVHAPFVPGGGGQLQRNMRLNLSRDRFEDRRQLLAAFNRLDRRMEEMEQVRAVDQVRSQAYQLLLSARVADALDLSKEDPRLVARYDTARYAKSDGWSKAARGKRGYYTGHARSLGKLLVLARRLCETGCGFVTIHAGYEGVWDMHADGNNLNMSDGMEAVGRSFDHAVAAFIHDLEARGMRDKILLVCCGEMGRSPRLNKGGGRDHWAKLAPLLLYGGGTTGGRVIGQSTKDGGEPVSDNLNPKHLISTILHTVCDVGQLRVMPGVAPVAQLAETPPIPGLS